MIPFPPVSPVIFQISIGGLTLALRWYALAYIAGLLIAWALMRRAIRTPRLWTNAPPLTIEQLERLMTWVILGVILGGRFGYVLFYQPQFYLAHPAMILRVWEGGMSFHGGFLGVVIAAMLFCWREKIAMLRLGDLFGMAAPPGLFLGRLANFVNAELWGRPTDLPWGVIFPGEVAQDCGQLVGLCARHPSQLYEAALEGLLLFVLLQIALRVFRAHQRPGLISALFFTGYGTFRFICEFYREPDTQFVGPLSMGMALSIPVWLAAAGLFWIAYRKPKAA